MIIVFQVVGDTIKLADVGFAKREIDMTCTIIGTDGYMAPEVRMYQEYDRSADIYSLGIILWEMWYGEPSDSLSAAVKCCLPDITKETTPPDEFSDLMLQCWNSVGRKRPSASQCLEIISHLDPGIDSDE